MEMCLNCLSARRQWLCFMFVFRDQVKQEHPWNYTYRKRTFSEIKDRVSAFLLWRRIKYVSFTWMSRTAETNWAISGWLDPIVIQVVFQISFFMNPPYPQTSACEINIEVFLKQKLSWLNQNQMHLCSKITGPDSARWAIMCSGIKDFSSTGKGN